MFVYKENIIRTYKQDIGSELASRSTKDVLFRGCASILDKTSADIIRKNFHNILLSGREWHNNSTLYEFVYQMHCIFQNIICNFLYYAPQEFYHKNSNTGRAML